MKAESAAKSQSMPVVYKKSHCTLSALMTQIESYCKGVTKTLSFTQLFFFVK